MMRLYDPGHLFPGFDPYEEHDYVAINEPTLIIRMFIVFIVFFSLTKKTLYYLKTVEDFTMMVELVTGTANRIIPFLFFFFFTITIFSISYSIINVTFEGSDENIIPEFNIFG